MTFSHSPRMLKGAFVQFDEQSSQEHTIVFQYNPDKICRKLEACTERSCMNYLRAVTSPRETITLTITLDATDNLEYVDKHPETVAAGIYPTLSAIEMLLYGQVSERSRRDFWGFSWLKPASKRPLTLFVWGEKRIVPVLVTNLQVIEEMFDPILTPMRASIEITMRVLNEVDLSHTDRGYEWWKTCIKTKVALAQTAYTDMQMNNLIKL